MEKNCIFCKIIAGEIPASKIYENEYVYVFNDIAPKAKKHILVIPKKHIKDYSEIQLPEDDKYVIEMVRAIQEVVKTEKIEDGYRVVTNKGKDGGQEVFHLHYHILGGEKLGGIC